MEQAAKTAEQLKTQFQAALQASEQRAETSNTSPSSDECPDCKGIGFIRLDGGVKSCACRLRRVIEARLRTIPVRYQFSTLENYEPKTELQAGTKSMIQGDPQGSYYISGPYGQGKTHLLMAQFREVALSGYPCQLWSTADLFDEMRRVELDGNHYSRLMEAVKESPEFHLFWDDCDKFKPTDFKGTALFTLTNTIFIRKLRLSVTSNYNLVALGDFEKLPPQVIRRIDDVCTAVGV